MTKNSFIVVNGMVASPFAHNHAVADSIYNVHRAIYSLFPSLLSSTFFKNVNEVFGEIVAAVSF